MAERCAPCSEGELIKRLRGRYEQQAGNGFAGALIPGVRDAAGFDAQRTIDALGVNFWPSRGLLLDAYECKSSRSDWQRELADPAKAEQFCQRVDRFWIVAGATGVVLEDEVPPDWGLLVARGKTLVQIRPAKLLHPDDFVGKRRRRVRPLPPGFDRGFLIAVIRQASACAKVTPEEIQQAHDDGYKEGEDAARASSSRYKELYDELYARVREFQQASGVTLGGMTWPADRTAAEVGAAVKAALQGDANADLLERRLRRLLDDAEAVAETARKHLAEYDMAPVP